MSDSPITTPPAATNADATAASDHGEAPQFPARPLQGTFSKPEKAFLEMYMPGYMAIVNDSNAKKGAKGNYVTIKAFPAYKTEYNSDGPDGPNLTDLLQVRIFFSISMPF